MKVQYPIFIEPGTDKTAWGIIVPDLPGCFSAADEEGDVLAHAREAILLHLEGEEAIPEPSSLSELRGDPEYAGFIISLVDVDLSAIEGPAKRINVTIPAGLLARIDAVAKQRGMTRSAFLGSAALREIGS
ncbi:MAG: type II toxin-antitoxin system HicB family antitoxin [Pseudomonadota bacterium]|nr:type II toxin-antitoxin system HicB family antitoxin [Pseudomonadota bacterium]